MPWWLLQDRFDLDGDVDAVADHDTTAFKGNVELHVEVASVKRSRRGEAGALVAVRVGPEPVDFDAQRQRAGDPVRGQFTVEGELFAVDLQPGRPVGHLRILVDFEEIL